MSSMKMLYVAYEDWRDRQFPPVILGVYEDEKECEAACIKRKKELIADGYEADEEFRIVYDEVLYHAK